MTMMTLDEIRESTINPEVAHEAHKQASERLADVLEAGKGFEQKAQAFFAGYISVALALFGAAGALMNDGTLTRVSAALMTAGAAYVVAAALCALAQMDRKYAALGSAPGQWLYRGAIDGPPGALPALLAYLTFHRHEEITRSAAHNDAKAGLIRGAIWFGVAGPLLLLTVLFFPAS